MDIEKDVSRPIKILLWAAACLFLLAKAPSITAMESQKAPTKKPNVILIVCDAMRADHLGVYGYRRNTSPAIDRLSRESVLFKNAISQAPTTIPSVLQLMTGNFLQGEKIDPKDITLAEALSQNGYATAAIVDNPNFELYNTGVARGFQDFYRNAVLDSTVEGQHYKTKTPADVVTQTAIRWLKKTSQRPFFLWLHYFDPHDPYSPPYALDLPFVDEHESAWTGDIRNTFLYAPDREKRPYTETDRLHLIDLYDAEIYYLNLCLQDLFDDLRKYGLYDESLIILTADHGESFGEHGTWFHGRSVFDSEIRIPLIIKLPAGSRRQETVAHPVQLINVYPTILSLLGLNVPAGVRKKNILTATDPYGFLLYGDWIVVRGARWKLISDEKEKMEFVFDVEQDPGETRNLASEKPAVLRTLRDAKRDWLKTLPQSYEAAAKQSKELMDRLKSLGYIK